MSESKETTETDQKAFDSFNEHQKDNRSRATQLVNYAFLLAGGTFTASITVFASRPKNQISPAIIGYLHNGWFNLFLSMVSFFALIFVMILRDYFIAEVTWRPRLYGKQSHMQGKKLAITLVAFEITLLSSGVFGFCTLSYGLYQIMEAACELIA